MGLFGESFSQDFALNNVLLSIPHEQMGKKSLFTDYFLSDLRSLV